MQYRNFKHANINLFHHNQIELQTRFVLPIVSLLSTMLFLACEDLDFIALKHFRCSIRATIWKYAKLQGTKQKQDILS